MKILRSIYILITVVLIASCEVEVNVYLDNPELSGNTAADFLEQVLVKKNSIRALPFMHEEFKKLLPEPNLKALIEQTRTVPDFKRIEAISYVKNADEKGNIAIYLEANRIDGANAFVIIFTNGGSTEGYKVLGFEFLNDIKSRDALPGERFKEIESKIVRSI